MKRSEWILAGAVVSLLASGILFWLSERTPERLSKVIIPNVSRSVFEVSPASDPAEAKSESERLVTIEGREAGEWSAEQMLAALQRIAITDPALALTRAQTCAGTDAEKGYFLTALAAAWAARDPSAAWEWTLAQSSRLSSLPGHPPLLQRVTDEMAKVDPKGLVAKAHLLMGSSRSSEDKSSITTAAMNALLKSGQGGLAVAAVNSWIHGPQKDDVSSESLAAVSSYMAQTSSRAKAASWLDSLPECAARAVALGLYATEWAAQDPAAALTWTANLGEMRPAAMRLAFFEWMNRDMNAAVEWLAPQISEDTDPAVDRLVRLFVDRCAPEDLPSIASWGQTIPGGELREYAVRQSVRRWAEQDYDAAKKYVQQSPQLTAEQKKDLSQYLQDMVQPSLP